MADEQLALIDGDERVAAIANKHSAAYVKERNPRLYQAIRLLIKYGVSGAEIADELEDEHGQGISRNLVSAVARQVAEEETGTGVEHHKKRLLAGFRRASMAAVTRAIELIESGKVTSLKELAIMAGIATEKEQLLEGLPTQRVETVDPAREALRQRLMGSQLTTPPGIGLGDGKELQRVPAPIVGRAGDRAVVEAEVVAKDSETLADGAGSLDAASNLDGDTSGDTQTPPLGASVRAGIFEGEGGVGAASATPIHDASARTENFSNGGDGVPEETAGETAAEE
jgi:hypothetical protein